MHSRSREDATDHPDTPAARPPGDWTLTLDHAGPGRFVAVLSDGLWGSEVAQGAWPPAGAAALPESIAAALARLPGARLRLQMRSAFDAWPWERELAGSASAACVVARFLTDLAPADPSADLSVDTPPLVACRAFVGSAHLAAVQAAHRHARPLVLVDAGLAEGQRLGLERLLRSHWRDALPLSDALQQSLAALGLAPECCRLYGDGRAEAADAEQGWRPVTALNIDLVGSTALMDTLGTERYAQRLQAYHARCREVIHRLDGSLDAPQGDDGLMAYFGFPLAVEDAAERALAAAWQLARGIAELGLQARIGVASGPAAVSAQQAFAPELHLAARLQKHAQPGEVLVAASTRDRVSAAFVLEPAAGPLALKDFPGETQAFRLTGLPAPPSATAPRPASHHPFIGRGQELETLRRAWASARDGASRWCVVHGEAGIGKSRLLQEFRRELQGAGQRCLVLTGQVHAGRSPFAAVIDGLRQHFGVEATHDATQLAHRLATLLPASAGDNADLASLLAPSPSAEPPRAGDGQPRWSELLLRCLLALIDERAFCLLIDDAHWLDPSSIDLLRRLRSARGERPLLVVLGERSESGWALALPGVDGVELQGLAPADAHELAGRLGAGVPESLRRQMVERAEGVPLYLEESLRVLHERGTGAGAQLPAKLEDLLMVRLDGLGADKPLAQLISVLGRECSALHLGALLAADDPFVARACRQGSLDALLASGLLQPVADAERGLRFKHALIRDAAYGSIWSDDRQRLHGLCADLIARCSPSLARERPELLAHHLEAGRRIEPARAAWQAAAQLAATRHAHREAVELAQRAMALLERAPPGPARAQAAMQLQLLTASAKIALDGYGSPGVEAAYLQAERAGNELADPAQGLRIRLGLEACYVMRGDLARAAELAQAAVAATDWQHDARLALQARWARANVCFHQGDWRAALAGFDDCLAHYRPDLHRRSSVQDPAIMCLGYASWIEVELGRADAALARIEQMLALAETLRHPFSSGVALAFAASIKRLCGDIDGAWPHAQEGVRVCEQGGFQVWLAHAWMVRGQLRADRGDMPGGDDDMDRGYARWVGSGARISCATYLGSRAELLLRQARTAAAKAALDQAWDLSEQIGEHYHQAELLRLQALCAWQAGDAPRADAVLRRALARAGAQHKPGLALRCALSLGALEASQGQCDEAAQRLRGLVETLPEHVRCRDARWARQALPCWEAGRAFASAPSTPWEPS